MENPFDEIWKAGEESLRWLEAYIARLPPIIPARDVQRFLNDPRWIDEENILKRAKNRERVAQQLAERRATDPDAYKKHEREARAKRRTAQRDRDAGGVSSSVRARESRMATLRAWPSVSEVLAGPWHVKGRPERRDNRVPSGA
jgi:ATPase subunit of ABC transporter with duplicated ATPase domains